MSTKKTQIMRRRAPRASPEQRRRPGARQVVNELMLVTLTLEAVLATTITAQAALEAVSVDVDSEIACCLRRNVSDRISEVMEKLGELIKLHGGSLRERLQ